MRSVFKIFIKKVYLFFRVSGFLKLITLFVQDESSEDFWLDADESHSEFVVFMLCHVRCKAPLFIQF